MATNNRKRKFEKRTQSPINSSSKPQILPTKWWEHFILSTYTVKLKVKVKLPLYLTKYQAMKIHLALNYIPSHEDVWASAGIAPHINILTSAAPPHVKQSLVTNE
jgi:hypothetical protein